MHADRCPFEPCHRSLRPGQRCHSHRHHLERPSIQENDEPPQDYLATSPQDFYSATPSDECTFGLPAEGLAQALIFHLDRRDVELTRFD